MMRGMTAVPRFDLDPTPSEEVQRQEDVVAPLVAAVRELVELGLDTAAPAEVLREAQADLEAVTARLRAAQADRPLGVRYNAEGRSWAWGNAVIGHRNATAPPLHTVREPGRPVHAEVVLGPAHQGDEPGVLHPGVAAKMLDHLMGVVAADGRRVTMTGTLTMRHLRPTPVGPVRLEGHIDREDGAKVYVVAHLADAQGVTVEADGIFIVPRWAR